MIIYLVRRYVDECAPREYGVCDRYYAIGLFSDESIANEVKEKAIAQAKLFDFEEEYSKHATEIDIIPIEVNKIYDMENQIYLGGGFYIE